MTAPSTFETSRPIDPRIRARRVAVTRAAGKRRLRILLSVVTLLCGFGLAWLTVQSPLLDVDHVRVVGAQQASRTAILEAAHVHRGAALLFIDTGAIARRVERVPGVGAAHVSRDLPGTLRIRVTERAPLAWARGPGGAVVIDRDGRVIRTTAAPPAGLAELRGLTRAGAPGTLVAPRGAANVLARLPAALRARVGAVLVAHGDVALRLSGAGGGVPAAEVRLGPPTDVAAKGAAALAVLQSLGAHAVAYVDVRVPDAPTTGGG